MNHERKTTNEILHIKIFLTNDILIEKYQIDILIILVLDEKISETEF